MWSCCSMEKLIGAAKEEDEDEFWAEMHDRWWRGDGSKARRLAFTMDGSEEVRGANNKLWTGKPRTLVLPPPELRQMYLADFKASAADLYGRYNPALLAERPFQIDYLCTKYPGKELALLERIQSKYLKVQQEQAEKKMLWVRKGAQRANQARWDDAESSLKSQQTTAALRKTEMQREHIDAQLEEAAKLL